MKPPNFPMTKDAYKHHLAKLVLAIVRQRGEITVGELHAEVNRLLALHGVTEAAEKVRAA